MLQFLQQYPIVGYLISIALLISYLFLLRKGSNWVWLETALAFSYVFSLPFINKLLSYWLGGLKGDVLSRNMLCLTILGMMSQGFAIYFTRKSVDPVVKTSLAIANVLARGGLFISAVYALYYIEGFNPLALKGDCVFLGVLLAGDLLQIKKVKRNYGYLSIKDKERMCAVVDAAASFLIGASVLCFPATTANFLMRSISFTGVHEMFMKSFGFQMIASSLLSCAALCYKDLKDAASVLKAKFLIYVPMLLTSFWYIITAEPGPTSWGCFLAGISTLFLVLNCIVSQIDSALLSFTYKFD